MATTTTTGKISLQDLQKPQPITKPTFIINSPTLQQYINDNTLDLASLLIYTLENPSAPGTFQKYMLIDYTLYEIHTVTPPSVKDTPHCRNSKFISNDYIEANATYFVSTPIDLMFIFLPYFLSKFKHNGIDTTIDGQPHCQLLDIISPGPKGLNTQNDTQSQQQQTQQQQQQQQQQQHSQHSQLHGSQATSVMQPSSISDSSELSIIDGLHSNYDILSSQTHLLQLYEHLFENPSMSTTQQDVLIKQFSRWCNIVPTVTTTNETSNYFRINFDKLNKTLHKKISHLCTQITATPSLQTLTITPNPKVNANQSTNKQGAIDDINVSLKDPKLGALSLSHEHFKNCFQSWDETSTTIYSHAFTLLGQYVPQSYLSYFVGLYTTHNNDKFTLELIKQQLSQKKKVVAKNQFILDDDDDDTNADKDYKTTTKNSTPAGKRADSMTNATEKNKKAKVAPKGQPSILKFLQKK